MSQRGHALTAAAGVSSAIRQEIQRFESVHPSIYAIYDLIEAIPDSELQNQIREHVVCIEDSFVNSQEWTLSRAVVDLKLGVLGFVQSGKSALVHRYLTSSYMQDESPEGGRFKKEVEIDGQSYLLLIRDEGGAPEPQFAHWVDAVILVFSLENEMSFNTVYSYYSRMSNYRNISEVPTILVGTQDAISESSPRVIDDARARKLAADLNRATYYETCAMYGLNVERVFHDACQKIIVQRQQSTSTSMSTVINGSRGMGFPSGTGGGPLGYGTPRGISGGSGAGVNGGGAGQPNAAFVQTQVTPGLPRSDSTVVSRSSSASDSTTPVSMRSLTPPDLQHGSLVRDHIGGSQRYDKRAVLQQQQQHQQLVHHSGQSASPSQLAAASASFHAHSQQAQLLQQQQQYQQQQQQPQQYHQQQPQQYHQQQPQQYQQQQPQYLQQTQPLSATVGQRALRDAAIPFAQQQQLQPMSQQQAGDDRLHRTTVAASALPGSGSGGSSMMPSSHLPHSSAQLNPSQSAASPAMGPTVQIPSSFLQQQQQQLPLSQSQQKPYAQSSSNPLPERPAGHPMHVATIDRQMSYNDAAHNQSEDPSLDQLSTTPPDMTPMSSRRTKKFMSSAAVKKSHSFHGMRRAQSSSTTPTSTPILSRKHTPKKPGSTAVSVPSKKDEDRKSDELGSGRAIPIKQGYLYKKGSKGLSKDWKKKYVTLTDDGKLVYHPNLHDYMEDVHGKEIKLMHSTVKIPGQAKPRTTPLTNGSVFSCDAGRGKDSDAALGLKAGEGSAAFSILRSPGGPESGMPVAGIQARIDSTTPQVKKRQHRRVKSSSKATASDPSQQSAAADDSDGYEFLIVSLENKQWHFEATSVEERADWINAIDQQILLSLQGNDSLKSKSACGDPSAVQAIKNISGNGQCCDCGTLGPTWASLNLGTLICIECSGIHRNLGTHLSRVRSLDLDEWPPDITAVMLSIGNHRANSVWEATAPKQRKPNPNSSREDRESWIRAKYEQKEFLPRRSRPEISIAQHLREAMQRPDMTQVILLLAHASPDDVSQPCGGGADTRTPLHVAAQLASVVFVQLLLWYGADVRKVDHLGRTALRYAKDAKSPECAAILVSSGCPENPTLGRAPPPPPGAGSGRRGSLLQAAPIAAAPSPSSSTLQQQRAGSTSSIGSGLASGGSAGEVLDKLPASAI